VFVVGLIAELLQRKGLVVVPPARHRHIGHRPRDPLSEDGVVAVGADAVGRMNRWGVAQCDVVFEVVGLENCSGLIDPSTNRGVNRYHVAFDLIPVMAGDEPKSVADQMDNAGLHDGTDGGTAPGCRITASELG
jgi:hypothetical protein